MNFTETFEQFSSRLTPTDLALYAGVGLIVWVLFKDKLTPLTSYLSPVMNKAKDLLPTHKNTEASTVIIPVVAPVKDIDKQDLFFKLVVSWKQTRDLAVDSGCAEAVKVADQMFPYLSPTVCSKKDSV